MSDADHVHVGNSIGGSWNGHRHLVIRVKIIFFESKRVLLGMRTLVFRKQACKNEKDTCILMFTCSDLAPDLH